MYVDDILIETGTIEEHVVVLWEVLLLLRQHVLELNREKFCYRELDYLGYRVNESGIRPNDDHIVAIRHYPAPTNSKETLHCLGLFSYFRRFVMNFSRIARSLTDLTKKNCRF